VGHRHILYPAHPRRVVDVPELVNVADLGRDPFFEGRQLPPPFWVSANA
jgi:hypothetical protein